MSEKTKSDERNFPDCDEIREDTPYHDRLYLDSDWMQEMYQCVVYAEGFDIKFKRQGHNMVITVVSEKLEAIRDIAEPYKNHCIKVVDQILGVLGDE